MNNIKNPEYPILLVDDEINLLNSFELTLMDHGFDHTITCSDSRNVMSILENNPVSMIMLDLSMPYIRGEELLKQIVPKYPELQIIVVTGDTEIETAVECMKLGAFDYIVKPVEYNRLINVINKATEIQKLRKENSSLKTILASDKINNPEAFSEIITQNSRMKSVFQYMEAISKTSEPILITGETGVGKELVARAIHRLSNKSGQFVTTNVAGLDDQMFSDTLFGHKRGAFTNAVQDRKGQIEKAAGGTIFLDEIGDLGFTSQVKLLRLLQEKEFYPLGSDDPRYTDALILLATNKNLEEMVENGSFRKDLYYRLKVHHISPIPLRDRLDDLPILIKHFLEKASKNFGKKIPTVPAELVTLLSTYDFPGNIRELQAMIFDAVGSHKSKIMSLKVFNEHINPTSKFEFVKNDPEITEKIIFGKELPTLKEIQKALVKEALKRTNNNQSIAAKLLGVTRQALNRRLIQEKKT
jgi:DNA-binding NtrC family response regulator